MTNAPYTPAWQEKFTGISRNTVIQFAREFATTAEKTGGKCTVIVGSGVNHWYHSNLHYRASIAALMLCGCVGVNGGGLITTRVRKSWCLRRPGRTLAMALDWTRPPAAERAIVPLRSQRSMAI